MERLTAATTGPNWSGPPIWPVTSSAVSTGTPLCSIMAIEWANRLCRIVRVSASAWGSLSSADCTGSARTAPSRCRTGRTATAATAAARKGRPARNTRLHATRIRVSSGRDAPAVR